MDSTVLIAHLRGDEDIAAELLMLLRAGHSLAVSCVNIVEIERGLHPAQRKPAEVLLERLEFFTTTPEAAARAGRYQADWSRRGRTIHLADALIAGTARAHGAVIMTDNVEDFPMRDVRVRRPERAVR
ncbi:MAG: PIN domain-containing protein [Actinomycetota bacterium]